MSIDFNKLYNPRCSKIESDTSEVDEILEQEEILYTISKNIIMYRKNHNLTQQQLADKIQVNQTMISKLERGDYNPTFKQIYKISRKLTNSAEMFINILSEIIKNMEKYISMTEVTLNTNNAYKSVENLYLKKDKKSNIISLSNIYKSNEEGEENYEQYKSEISIAG